MVSMKTASGMFITITRLVQPVNHLNVCSNKQQKSINFRHTLLNLFPRIASNADGNLLPRESVSAMSSTIWSNAETHGHIYLHCSKQPPTDECQETLSNTRFYYFYCLHPVAQVWVTMVHIQPSTQQSLLITLHISALMGHLQVFHLHITHWIATWAPCIPTYIHRLKAAMLVFHLHFTWGY
jgi:hypothetical protein